MVTGLVVPSCKKLKTSNIEANFEIELHNGSRSEIADYEIAEYEVTVFDMDQDFFEESPINGDRNIEAYSKLIVNEANASDTKNDNKTPEPIMVKILTMQRILP